MSAITLGTIIGEIPLRIDSADIVTARFPVSVKLLVDYEMRDPREWSPRPIVMRVGIAQYPHLARKGTTIEVERCEAMALVAAGAGEITGGGAA
jgi:hypothetical protein